MVVLNSCDFINSMNKGNTLDILGDKEDLNVLNNDTTTIIDPVSRNPKTITTDTLLPEPNKTVVITEDDVPTKLLNATVIIYLFDKYGNDLGQGSGFFIDSGYVVTNYHVIEDAKRIEIYTHNKKIHLFGEVEKIDEEHDLAIISTGYHHQYTVNLTAEIPTVGTEIFVAGAPVGLAGSLSTGIISAIRDDVEFGFDCFQITAAISPGSSGGPVVNNSGNLLGVACSGRSDGNSLYFAVPAKHIVNLKNRND